MNLPDLSLRRPVGTAMLYVGIAVLGTLAFLRLPVDLLPDVSFPTLSVSTLYRDAGPPEVERFVSEHVEAELSRVPGVQRVTSRSREGLSLVRLQFHWGTDMEFATLRVRERLDALTDRFPRGVERPVILSADPAQDPILTLSATGSDLLTVRELSEAVFKRRLEQLDGVALAAVAGGPRREVRVVMDPERMAVHGVGMDDVTRALDRANYSAPGGTVRQGRFQYSLRTVGHFASVEELREVGIRPGDDGRAVRLAELAEVADAFADPVTEARWNGQPAVGIQVYKEAGANTVRVSDRVEETVAQLRAEHPEVALEVATSQAGFIRAAISDVTQALVLGGLLAFLVLFLFLREPRYPVAVGLAIPLSVLAALSLFYLFDVGLNVMSLGGLALGVGMLVDNSIVVLENIFRHRDEEGAGRREASSAGAREVAMAITASTLTTIAVFGPILYVEGVAGALFGDLSLAVAFSLLASLLVALTLLPVMAAGSAGRVRALADRWADRLLGPLFRRFDRALEAFTRHYERALEWSLDHRAVVVMVAALSLAGALALGATLPRSLMPDVDEGRFQVELELPAGTPLPVTSEAAGRLEATLLGMEGVEGVYTRVGRARAAELGIGELDGPNAAVLDVRLADGASVGRVVPAFRERVAAAGVEPGFVAVETGSATALGRVLELGEADLAVRLKGGDLDALAEAADSARARIADLPRLADVRVDLQREQPELVVEVNRPAAARHGLGVAEVADAVEAYLRGTEPARPYMEFAEQVGIRVTVPATRRAGLRDVLDLPVDGVPLGELVSVREGVGPVEIRREDQARTVRVLADVTGGGIDRAVRDVEARLAGLELPPLAVLEVGGEGEEMRRSFRSLLAALGLALFLVFLILAAQFESVRQPLVILGAVPLAAVGVVAGLWAVGAGVNVMSAIGVLILVGIVVNDAIIKVDFINQRRAAGYARRAAIREAGRLRLRPIVMTTVTTVLGLTPLALGWGAGAELRSPLAVAVIGGMLSATFLTLLVVPVLYSLVTPDDGRAAPAVGARRPAEGAGDDGGGAP